MQMPLSFSCGLFSFKWFVVFFVLKPKGQIDMPEEFVMALNSSEFRGDKRCEVISALRVALTNNPVS